MPPGKGHKNKFKENRQSRSRNTTPSSVISGPASAVPPDSGNTAYLNIPLTSLVIPSNLLYEDTIERSATNGIPDAKVLDSLAGSLRTLKQLSGDRESAIEGIMRQLGTQRKIVIEDEQERARELREKGEAEERAKLKRLKEEDEDIGPMTPKFKKRKDLGKAREERPLAVGAHGVARQDGTDPKKKGLASPQSRARANSDGSSSLSPPSQLESPLLKKDIDIQPRAASPAGSESSVESHQPPKAASIPQYQTFGANPLTFDDPTVYHVRDVTPDMSDSEKREIYSVASFPKSDLRDLIAGTIPDKDFSNAKPSNQVNFNTFQTYIDGYFRPLNDEDLQFLRERGDRVQPFLMPRRSAKTYQQIWAEEDGVILIDRQRDRDKLPPPNEPRGSIEEMDEAGLETENISSGPMMSRLLATMRFEHRPEETEKTTNGSGATNGDANGDSMSLDDPFGPAANNLFGTEETTSERPSAAYFPESQNPNWKIAPARQDYAQEDERLKAELRYLGLLGMDDEPDYDAHFDDEVGQRLRLLQEQLRETMVINSARKARLLSIAEDHMGYQEFSTIRDDLDNQVNQAFSKRNRMTGKGKKHHHLKKIGIATAPAAGISRPGIGDAARTLMDRRKRWKATIEPIFGEEVTKVRIKGETVFDEDKMQGLIKEERERLEEELAMANV